MSTLPRDTIAFQKKRHIHACHCPFFRHFFLFGLVSFTWREMFNKSLKATFIPGSNDQILSYGTESIFRKERKKIMKNIFATRESY